MNNRANQIDTLEGKIELEIGNATKSIETLISSLGSLKTALNNTLNSSGTNQFKNNIDSATKTTDNLKKALNFGAIAYGVKRAWDGVWGLAQANMNMTETANMFEVQLGKVVDQYGNLDQAQSQYYTRAMAFQDQMNEKLATNKSELMKYQAMYFGMLQPQLQNDDLSYRMSESLTKAGYDIASLYNLNVDTAMNKLKSGLAGQIESLRQIGIDVSESSLNSILDQVGIERSVQKLSYAEKEVARYIAIMQQGGKAQGDFARTFESGANQVRVFQNQLAELGQVAGAFFMGLFGQILPVVNGIIMAIKEVLKALASLFGFDLNLSSSGATGGSTIGSGLGGVSTGAGNAGKNLDKATKSAKEFKKQLMGFDEINNIEKPTENAGSSGGSGGSGGVGGVGGIDPKLLDAFKEWDNMMSSISGKAQEIRDKILDWLGVTDGTFANLKRIWEVVQMIGIAFATWKVAKTITDLLNNLGILNKTQAFQIAFGLTLLLTGLFAQYKGTKRLLEGDVNLFSILETLFGTGAGAFGIANLLRAIKAGKAFTWGEGLKIGFGVMLAIQGVQVLLDGVQKGDIKKTLLGAFELTGSLTVAFKTLAGNESFQTLITKFKSFGEAVKQGCGNAKTWISLIVEQYKIFRSNGNSVIESMKLTAGQLTSTGSGFADFAKKAGIVVAGVAGVAGGSLMAYDAVKGLGEGTRDATTGCLELVGGLGLATASGALAGSQFGTVGTVIGALVGGITGAISAIAGLNSAFSGKEINTYKEETEDLKKSIDDEIQSFKDSKKAIEDTYQSKINDCTYSEQLSSQLEDLVDSNGKVIEGNEKRVDFILGELNNALGTELSRDGDVIKKNGDVVKSYGDLKQSIDEVIQKKKDEAKQEAIMEGYKEALKERISLEVKRNKLLSESKKIQEEYNKATEGMSEAEKFMWRQSKSAEELRKSTENVNNSFKEVLGAIEENGEDVQYYEEQIGTVFQETTDGLVEGNQQVAESTQQTAEQVKVSLDQLSADMLASGQVTSDQFTEMIQNGGDKLIEMVANDTAKWDELYNNANASQQASMLAQSTTLDTWSPELQNKWKDMANGSSEEYQKALEGVNPYTRTLIETTIGGVASLTPENIKKWKDMATNSHDDYIKALDSVDDDTKLILKSTIDGVENLSPTEIQKWADMAKNSNDKYNQNLKSLDTDTSTKIQSCVDVINNKGWTAEQAGQGLADAVERGTNTIDTTESGKNAVGGVAQGIEDNKNSKSLWESISDVCSNVKKWFNQLFDSHSPSRVMAKLAKNIPTGIAKGISDNADETIKPVRSLVKGITDEFSNADIPDIIQELNEGIKINPQALSINTSQFIDYGAVRGQIQSSISANSNIGKQIAKEVKYAMQNSEVNVNIEARTDEGVMVKKVAQGFDDYVTRTGDLPFTVPI